MRKTRAAAEGFMRLQGSLDKILTSPWLRASQTAGILADVLGMEHPVELPELAGDRSPEELLKALSGQSGNVVLVGHEPLLSETVARPLSGKNRLQIDLKKAGACAVS